MEQTVNQTVKDRIKIFIGYKKMSVRAFESQCGFSYGFIGNMKYSMKPDKIMRISHCFPELNTTWLLTGEGEMLTAEKEATDAAHEAPAAADLLPQIFHSMAQTQQAIASLLTRFDSTINSYNGTLHNFGSTLTGYSSLLSQYAAITTQQNALLHQLIRHFLLTPNVSKQC